MTKRHKVHLTTLNSEFAVAVPAAAVTAALLAGGHSSRGDTASSPLGGPYGPSPLLLPKGVGFRQQPPVPTSPADDDPLHLEFVLPAGAAPGHALSLQLPDGQLAEWIVPPGLVPGQRCRLPPPPSAEATAEAAEERESTERALSGGHAVNDAVRTWQGERGTVRYVGRLQGQSEAKIWIGIEWAARGGRGKHDGTAPDGTRYFSCPPVTSDPAVWWLHLCI